MIELNLIKYDNANVLEATWAEVTTEESQAPIMELNEDGKEADSEKTETREIKTQIKCHAYDGTQIDMLRADALELGTSLEEYEELIAEVEANVVLPTQEELDAIALEQAKQEARAYLASTDWYAIRLADTGEVIPQDVKDKRAEARAIL